MPMGTLLSNVAAGQSFSSESNEGCIENQPVAHPEVLAAKCGAN